MTTKFFNRELSWLEFNYRVLEEAFDFEEPLLERLRFIAIFTSNLDEFIMVRVAKVIRSSDSEYKKFYPTYHSKEELLKLISQRINELVKLQYSCFGNLLKELTKHNIIIHTKNDLPQKYLNFLKEIFDEKLYLIITPMAIDQSRPFPDLTSKTLNILVKLKKNNEYLFAVVPVPNYDRFIRLPDKNNDRFIYLEEVIKLFLPQFFIGYEVISYCTFRITRDAELTIDEEDTIDLLSAIENQLKQRARGKPIRIEIEKETDIDLINFLLQKIDYQEGFLFEIEGPLDLSAFFYIVNINGHESIKNIPLEPTIPLWFDKRKSIFEIIKEKDRLLHLPFESFDPVVRFIEEASNDPKVLAIKITLYRTSSNSPIIKALKQAAESKKQVTVLVELRARFDEERNINWAKILDESGCHVIYGLVGLKIHCKMALIVREEDDGIKRYIHLSTGNYNESTAKLYTDIGFFTANPLIAQDVSSLFNMLTGYSEPTRWNKLACAPLDLRNFFLEKIKIEELNAKKGGIGQIIAKVNSLIDTEIIKALYKASASGVKITLIVRGMCCLVPEIPSLSENIKVISIVDRFLEHSRIFYFYSAGEEEIYLSSADWMERNLDSRVEIAFPIEDSELKAELKNYISYLLKDNRKARVLHKNGRYEKIKPDDKIYRSQIDYYYYITEKNKKRDDITHPFFILAKNPEEEKK